MKVYFFPSSAASVGLVLLQPVEVFQEQQPGGLLGVVQFGGAAGLFPEDVVDVFEGLFKHGYLLLFELKNKRPAFHRHNLSNRAGLAAVYMTVC